MRCWLILALTGCVHARPAATAHRVVYAELGPYLVANLWPHAVKPAGDGESFVHVAPQDESTTQLDDIQFHMATCIGPIYKGAGLIATPDDRLIELGCKLAQSDDVEQRGIDHFREIAKSVDFTTYSTVADRLKFLRTEMVNRLVHDAAVKHIACTRFAAELADC